MQKSKGRPSVSYSFTMQLTYPNLVGMFASIAQTIGHHGGDLGSVDIVSTDSKTMVRDVTVMARDQQHVEELVEAVDHLPQMEGGHFSDPGFQLHARGQNFP